MQRYLLIDGNNITHAAQSAKKLTVGNIEVQAIFGFIRTMHKMMRVYPLMKPIVLWDGASWRKMHAPEYKENREANHTKAYEKAQVERKAAKNQIPAIKKGLTLLGIDQVKASNMEADDLAAILGDKFTKRGDRVLLVSGDKDWIQLVTPTMGWFDPIQDRKIFKAADCEGAIKIKVDNFRQFLEIKALMGDIGDNIAGVGGIGEKGAQHFIDVFGSWANFSNMAMDGTWAIAFNEVEPRYRKVFQTLVDDENKRLLFSRNMHLMDLRTPARPAPVNLVVTRGEPDRARFETFCQRLVFLSFLKDLDAWLTVFPAFRLKEAA